MQLLGRLVDLIDTVYSSIKISVLPLTKIIKKHKGLSNCFVHPTTKRRKKIQFEKYIKSVLSEEKKTLEITSIVNWWADLRIYLRVFRLLRFLFTYKYILPKKRQDRTQIGISLGFHFIFLIQLDCFFQTILVCFAIYELTKKFSIILIPNTQCIKKKNWFYWFLKALNLLLQYMN